MERTLKDSHGGGEVVDAAGGLKSGDDDGGRRDEIVGEGVVQVALQLEHVRNTLEFLLVSACRRAGIS